MIYKIIFGALFMVYYLRKYWLNPWATYVSHSDTKTGHTFLTVKHVHWYPPFLEYNEVYHHSRGTVWSSEKTGRIPDDSDLNRQVKLTNIYLVAKARLEELEELSW